MEKQTAHIGLLLDENLPEQLITKYKQELFHPNLEIDIRKFNFGAPYNSLEWAVPTAIGVYILKPYFTSFLNEAGKDHYLLFKKWLKKTSTNTRPVKIHTIAAEQSKDKLDKSYSQSKVFSIQILCKDASHRIRFLFDNNLSDKAWKKAIDKMFELLEEHFSDNKDDHISLLIQENDFAKDIWAFINSEEGNWEFFDFRKIASDSISKRSNRV